MIDLKLSEKTARKIYNSAPQELKEILRESCPSNFFTQSLKESIKTWEDAVSFIGDEEETRLPFPEAKTKKHHAMNAHFKLCTIIELFKEGQRLDYSNSSQGKYYPYFRRNGSGFAFAAAYTFYDRTDTVVGPRLSSLNRETAAHIATQFEELYKTYFTE